MKRLHNPDLVKNSQSLRRQMTDEEKKLWYCFLRELGIFQRQKVLGKYIVDFYCAGAKIVIELDGAQHYEDEGKRADLERDAYLESLGIEVLRYSNYDFNRNFKGICEDIWNHIEARRRW